MNGPQIIAVASALWVGAGLTSALWMARRGHRDPLWLLIAVGLGPALAVIAPERIERTPRILTAEEHGPPAAAGVQVLVGVDGSPESWAALRDVLTLFSGRLGRLTVAEVVDYDAAEVDWRGKQAAARQHLAGILGDCGEQQVVCEVLTGPPVPALLRCAEQQHVDLIAVGRRGHGPSVRLLGSVADELVHAAPVPVLIGVSHHAAELSGTFGPAHAGSDEAGWPSDQSSAGSADRRGDHTRM
jgi:nucleotide-binding universal stress UspA family protein